MKSTSSELSPILILQSKIFRDPPRAEVSEASVYQVPQSDQTQENKNTLR